MVVWSEVLWILMTRLAFSICWYWQNIIHFTKSHKILLFSVRYNGRWFLQKWSRQELKSLFLSIALHSYARFVAIVYQETMTLFRYSSTTNLKIYKPSYVLWTFNKNTEENIHKEYFLVKEKEIRKNNVWNEVIQIVDLDSIYSTSKVVVNSHNSWEKYFMKKCRTFSYQPKILIKSNRYLDIFSVELMFKTPPFFLMVLFTYYFPQYNQIF